MSPKKKTEKPKKRFQYLINTAVKDEDCPVCRRAIYSAYDGGIKVKAEKNALTEPEEIIALVQGQRTYTRQPWGGLLHRDAAEITAGLRPGETIHQQHRCKGKAR